MRIISTKGEGGVYLHAAPIFHIADFPAMFAAPAFGACQITIPKFSPQGFCELVQRERVTHTVLVPTMLNLLTQMPEAKPYDLSSLEVRAYGGSPMAPELVRRTRKLLPNVKLLQCYGLSETGFLTGPEDQEHIEAKLLRIFTIAKKRAHATGHAADHVNYLGLGGTKDWQLIATIRAKEYSFVTNNRFDFLALHGQEPLHAGVIIIVSSVTPARQRELFSSALKHIEVRDPTNTVVEVKSIGNRIECSEYNLPDPANDPSPAPDSKRLNESLHFPFFSGYWKISAGKFSKNGRRSQRQKLFEASDVDMIFVP